MAQSLSKMYLHVVFHIKTTSPSIREEHLPSVFGFVGEIINQLGCQTITVGGTRTHIHALLLLSRTLSVSQLMEEIKRKSSHRIKDWGRYYNLFMWQGGYACFSVSQSVTQKAIDYIKNQEEHHHRVTFEEEYRALLRMHQIDYDEHYAFSD